MPPDPTDLQPSRKRPSLEYQSLPSDPDTRPWDLRDLILGAVLSTAATMGSIFLYIMSNIVRGPPGTPPNIAFPLACALVVFGVLGGIAYYKWTRQRSKAFAVGLLIGVGIGILLEGLCFVVVLSLKSI